MKTTLPHRATCDPISISPKKGEVRVTADSQAMTVPGQSYTVLVYELQPASAPRLKPQSFISQHPIHGNDVIE